MKILFVATVDIHIINHHLRTIHQLHEMGHEIDVAANGSFINEDIHKKYNVCFSKSPTSSDNLKAYRFMKELLSKESYDIISCHTPLSSFFTRIAAKNINAKVIYTAHGFHFYKGAPFINNTIYKTMERIAANYTDILVTINNEDYEAAKQFQLKQNGEVRYIPGVGVNLNEIEACRISREEVLNRLDIPQNAFLLMSIGELNKNKNHLFVIRTLESVFKSNPNLHYVICGKDLWNGRYQTVINELGLQNQVHLAGYREDVRSLLYGADLYFSPSFREGLPVSVIEAMAAGVPVIASDVRGNHDLITSGTDGFLYPVESTDDFMHCFDALYQNENLRKIFSEKGKETAKQYSNEAIDPLILDLYKK